MDTFHEIRIKLQKVKLENTTTIVRKTGWKATTICAHSPQSEHLRRCAWQQENSHYVIGIFIEAQAVCLDKYSPAEDLIKWVLHN